MTAPELTRTGCRVVDAQGEDWAERGWEDTGYAEWRAVKRASYLAECVSDYAPFRVTDADGVTLHTIDALEGK